MSTKAVGVLLGIAGGLFLLSKAKAAPLENPSISGTVTVASNDLNIPIAPVIGLTMTLTDNFGNQFETVTDAEGYFAFYGLEPGTYNIYCATSYDSWDQDVEIPYNEPYNILLMNIVFFPN